MRSKLVRFVRRGVLGMLLVLMTFLAVRAYDSQRGAPLELWHTWVPDELDAQELDEADWGDYLEAEAAIFERMREEVTQRLDPEDRVPINRYFAGAPVYPGAFSTDWNRSFVLEPDGEPAGAVVLLHGLTDSPYSSRNIARRYRSHGFVAVAIRLPAHGTVPGALTRVEWQDWLAATRLAVREARRLSGASKPLHLVGYSNGGALALKYALDAIDDEALARPDRIVLISPMVGVTRMARFAGLAGLPAILPAFAKAAWLGILPEFNPFKYNSFPINAARQAHQLTLALQERIRRHARDGRLERLAPILAFQSVVDFTVTTRAVVSALFVHLPPNGSELVLFDLNRSVDFGPLLRSSLDTLLAGILPEPPRPFRTTIVTNADSDEVVARRTDAASTTEQILPLGTPYPAGFFSLSHVALPFPTDDPLYGAQPDGSEDFGIRLGAIAARGERGALILSLDSLLRASSNPFFPYLLDRIEEGIPGTSTGGAAGGIRH